METRYITVDALNPDQRVIDSCAMVIRGGGLVAFPTETVYGLGANALDPTAVAKIFAAKGRPQDNPLIVHVSRIEGVNLLVQEIPDKAAILMERFWPGPLTILFPKSSLIPDVVTAGLPLVAIRMPDHPVAHLLIDRAEVPIAAPSANASGRPSPTTAQAVLADLAGKIDVILDGGPCDIGVESTVIDVSGPVPRILRPGGVTKEDIEAVLGQTIVADRPVDGKVLSPGMKYRHYSPKAQVLLATGNEEEQLDSIALAAWKERFRGKKCVVLSSSENKRFADKLASSNEFVKVIELGPRQDLAPVASRLFMSLRMADQYGADTVLSETFPETGLGLAVANRLRRASSGILPKASVGLRALLVCSGNTCRSPMAEALLRNAWQSKPRPFPLEVRSAGTGALDQELASENARKAMAARGIDISNHRSCRVTSEMLKWADVVITMGQSHAARLAKDFPGEAEKVHTLGELVPEVLKGDVEDPYGGDLEVYMNTAAALETAIKALVEKIVSYRQPGDFGVGNFDATLN